MWAHYFDTIYHINDLLTTSQRYQGVAQLEPLEILIASYGDTVTPVGAIDITDQLNAVVMKFLGHDRLPFRDSQRFDSLFGGDPSPGKPKQMRIRYR